MLATIMQGGLQTSCKGACRSHARELADLMQGSLQTSCKGACRPRARKLADLLQGSLIPISANELLHVELTFDYWLLAKRRKQLIESNDRQQKRGADSAGGCRLHKNKTKLCSTIHQAACIGTTQIFNRALNERKIPCR